MVSPLAIRTKVHAFKPGIGDEFLMAIKIRSTPNFGGEVKPEAQCRKYLRHVKTLSSINKSTSQGQIHKLLLQVPPDLLLDDSAGGTARELWWTTQEFSLVDIISPWFSVFIYHLGDDRFVVGRSLETPSTRSALSTYLHDIFLSIYKYIAKYR
jgi:hypothetical protein